MTPSERDASPRSIAAALALVAALATTLVGTPAAFADPLPLGQYGTGTLGVAAGELNFPQGVATDAGGNVYVADTDNNRVAVFGPQGTFLRAFGFDVIPGGGAGLEVCTTTCQEGAFGGGAGALGSPHGIATDSTTNLYVADANNHRISVFTAQGVFLRAFGFDVIPGGGAGLEVCTTSCKAGLSGGGAGQLNSPFGVATDPAGNVYVADSLNNRISVLTAQGQFLRAFGFDVIPGGGAGLEVCTTSCKAGVSGGGAGQLNFAFDVAAGSAGNLYVAEGNNHRVSAFTGEGAFLRAFGFDVDPGGGAGFEVCTTSCKQGVAGSAAGQLRSPNGLGTDPAGNVYVADTQNDRVVAFTGEGAFLRAFGFDVDPGGGAGFELCTTSCQQGVAGAATGQLDFPTALATDPNGDLYVAELDNSRIQRFGEPRTAPPPGAGPPGAGQNGTVADARCSQLRKKVKTAKSKKAKRKLRRKLRQRGC